MKPDKKQGFFDFSDNRRIVRKYFYFLLFILLAVDLATYFVFDRSGHFPWETLPFFNAFFGFTACVGLVFIARILRWIVRRKEGYYD